MAKVEQPVLVAPKRRNGKNPNTLARHVDHIISIQGASDSDITAKFKGPPVNEHIVNGIIHSTMEGLKSNMKINLPIIKDINDDEKRLQGISYETEADNKGLPKNSNLMNNSREIIDLSPIYENSSDTYSSHNDLQEVEENEFNKSCKVLNSNDSLFATSNSISQTHSENSSELGHLTDSLKGSAKQKKRVNIISDIIESENTDLRIGSESPLSPEYSFTENSGHLTMTGTIKRGKKKGQNVDVKLNISREELEMIEASIVAEEYSKMNVSKCSLYNGPHIFIFTVLCIPFVLCISAVYSFYMGTITWYNIFNHISEQMTCVKKAVLAPIVILTYPFLIAIFTLGLGVYAGIIQLTFSAVNWWKVVCDFEKGFYGCLCNFLGLSECSPYEVVILIDVKPST